MQCMSNATKQQLATARYLAAIALARINLVLGK